MKVEDIEGYKGTVIRVFIFPEWAMEPGMERKDYLLFLDDIFFPHGVVSSWYAESVSKEMARNTLKDLTIYDNFYVYIEIFYPGEEIRKLIANV